MKGSNSFFPLPQPCWTEETLNRPFGVPPAGDMVSFRSHSLNTAEPKSAGADRNKCIFSGNSFPGGRQQRGPLPRSEAAGRRLPPLPALRRSEMSSSLRCEAPRAPRGSGEVQEPEEVLQTRFQRAAVWGVAGLPRLALPRVFCTRLPVLSSGARRERKGGGK